MTSTTWNGLTVRRIDDWVELVGEPSHQQLRARRVRLYGCPCVGCSGPRNHSLLGGWRPFPIPHPVTEGATCVAILGGNPDTPPRRALNE